MHTPTAAQLRTAIEVLRKLDERINKEVAHSVMQLPDSRLGDQYSERIEAGMLQRSAPIQTVVAQLRNWREELLEQKRHAVSHDV